MCSFLKILLLELKLMNMHMCEWIRWGTQHFPNPSSVSKTLNPGNNAKSSSVEFERKVKET
jgi:hypothetical protein